MSAPFHVEHATRSSHVGTAMFAVAFVLLAAAPFWGGRDDLRLLSEIYAYVALASLWNLLAGYAGLVSVGQQAYVGLGGYVLFASTILGGFHPLVAVPLAGAVAAVVALPVAGLMFRLRGHYFAIGTWVVAEVFRLIASQISALGGGSGISLPAGIVTAMASSRQMREFLIYWVALALVVIVLGAIVLLLRSRYGLALTAIRDNELAARSNGVDVTRTKLVVYVLTALRHRHDRRADLPAEAADLPRHRVQRQRLDRLRHLHHRDRRHRAGRGADHRHHRILPAAADAGRSRQPLPAHARRRGHRGHAVRAQGHLGPRRRPLRLAAFAAGAALALYARCPHNLVQTSQRNRERTMAAKSDKVVISCAVTGAIHTPTMSECLPITPDQIAEQAIGAAEAGAAILHLHARNPQDGRPTGDPAVFMEFLPRIKQATDAVVNITTGGSPTMAVEERLAGVMKLSPEMCSLNMGSMNFGLYPMAARFKKWKYDWEEPYLLGTNKTIFSNTFHDIERISKLMGEGHGTKFEHECYDVGHLYNLAHGVDKGWFKPPIFLQLIFGILGGIGADMENLVFMKRTADKLFGEDYSWSVLGAGRHQIPFATQAVMMGGNVRVGLEDSLYIGRGQLAKSNAEQVAKMRRLIEELGYQVATPKEAREILGLKGQDRTKF